MASKPEIGGEGIRAYLRGVDLVKLTEKYLNGDFRGLKTPISVDPNLPESVVLNSSIVKVKETPKNKFFQLDLGSGVLFACLGYKLYNKEGNYTSYDQEDKKTYRCMYCLRKIGNSTEAMGIPIYRTSIVNSQGQEVIYYHMIDIFCQIRCAYGELRRRLSNPLYTHSLEYLAEIYNKATGLEFSELKPSSDPRLLKIFNGPLSWKEYHNEQTGFIERPGNVCYLPTLEFLEQTPTLPKLEES